MAGEQRIKWMRQALELAAQATGKVAPNPAVGAVLVKKGMLVGQGYHQLFGGRHAEINALADCSAKGNESSGACLYVTLEPCCHQGKTGPCTEAIVQAGVNQVVVGCLDENPQVAGKGIAWLRERDISVEVGCCEDEARRLVAGFFKWQRTGWPRVMLKWAQSLDGQLAWPIGSERRWISNEKSREHVQWLRQRYGAILVGIETVLADDPKLSVRLRGATYQPVRVVLDSQLRLPAEGHLAQTARQQPVWIFTLAQTVKQNAAKVEQLKQLGCEIMAVSSGWPPQAKLGEGSYEKPSPSPAELRMPPNEVSGRIDLTGVLAYLGEKGITDLLVEGGAKVIGSFLDQGLADEMAVYIAPVVIASDATTSQGHGQAAFARATQSLKPSLNPSDLRLPPGVHLSDDQLDDVRISHFDQDVLIEGVVVNM